MWCLETIVKINEEQAKGKTAVEAYEACGIRVLGNAKRGTDGKVSNASVPIGNVRDNALRLAS
jgi:hypothetical protein